MKECKCGSNEFITKPIWYEVYEIIEGQLNYVKKELIDEEIEFYCRNCSEKLINVKPLYNN